MIEYQIIRLLTETPPAANPSYDADGDVGAPRAKRRTRMRRYHKPQFLVCMM